MSDFLKFNKELLLKGLVIIVLILSFFFLDKVFSYLFFDQDYQLAKISAIETKLLKQWQKAKGLKKTLKLNSRGPEVVLLQKILAQDPTIYPEKKITGYYGKATQKAVLRFQAEYNLPQTGIVDEATREKINEILLKFLCPEPTDIYPDFSLRKIQKNKKIPLNYVPSSLVNITDEVRTIGIICLQKEAAESLKQMFADAEKDGVYLAVTSGYRSPEIQKYLYNFWLRVQGPSALNEVAEPGSSEHQLGTTVDLTDASIGYIGGSRRFGRSIGGRWLQRNAYKYGFIMSYPRGKEKETGYKYEPWHWRFVGKEIAMAIYDQKITFNESSLEPQLKPFPKPDLNNGLKISANAVLSMYVNPDGKEYILLEKNKNQRLPMASLTKLTTALVASDIYRQNDPVVISQNALNIKGVSGYYNIGDTFYFNDSLYALLVSSHNEVAVSLAEKIGQDVFVQKMNEKVKSLGLSDTYLANVTGLDPVMETEEINYTTALDIARLLRYIFENRADLFSILEKSKYTLTELQSNRKISIETTNKLIVNQNTDLKILGGKTGETPKAKMNLAIVSKAPIDGYIVSVVLGSEQSFDDMQKLLTYIKNSFIWQ